MEKQIKVHVVGRSIEYATWLKNYILEKNILNADLVLFTGGEDVSPSFYNEKRNPKTACNPIRDYSELASFETAKQNKIPMLGICRGSQFLCAMSGGKLVQHQQNSYSYHPIDTPEGTMVISSTHHQAMFPYKMPENEYRLLGWTEGLSKMHEDGDGEEMINHTELKEAEIVYFPKTKALGIQGHPEYMSWSNKEHAKTLEYCNELVTNLLNKKL
jgi:gamma-glutamyl-gamma-aminobutyrate hydrolase PuuD